MTMLTPEERAGLEAMPREDLAKLLELIRTARALFGARGGGLPQSAIDDLVKTVPTELCQAIVKDLSNGTGTPGWMPPGPGPSKEELNKPDPQKDATPSYLKRENERSGWQKPIEMGNPPGVDICDRMLDVQDALDKRNLERRLRGDG
jgi:hypothetical protein